MPSRDSKRKQAAKIRRIKEELYLQCPHLETCPPAGAGKTFWKETAAKLQNLPQHVQDDFWHALWSSGLWYDTILEAILRDHIISMLNTIPQGRPSSEGRWYAPIWCANCSDYEKDLLLDEQVQKWSKKGTKPNAERDDRIVRMRDEGKLTFGQIGLKLGMSAAAAKRAYYRAKKSVRVTHRFLQGREPGTIRVQKEQ